MNGGPSVSGSVAARFGASARTYDNHSRIQRTVAERLVEFLPPDLSPRRILEVGCGTGLFTHLVAHRFPGVPIHALDISETMVRQARERLGDCPQIRWSVADARRFDDREQYSLIVSSSAMQWMIPLPETFRRLAARLEPGGRMSAALMSAGTLRELNRERLLAAPHKPPPILLPSPGEVADAAESAGLVLTNQDEREFRAEHESAFAFLKSLHSQGVTGVVNGGTTLLGRSDLRRIAENYRERYATPSGGVFATYKVFFFTAMKEKS